MYAIRSRFRSSPPNISNRDKKQQMVQPPLATDANWTDSSTGEHRTHTEWHSLAAWNDLGTQLCILLARKSTSVRVPLRIRFRTRERAFRKRQLVFSGSLQPLSKEPAFDLFFRFLFRQDWIVYTKRRSADPVFSGPLIVTINLAADSQQMIPPVRWNAPRLIPHPQKIRSRIQIPPGCLPHCSYPPKARSPSFKRFNLSCSSDLPNTAPHASRG
jgi:hypothetical protein